MGGVVAAGISKPPLSATQPPHRMELTIVAQGLAYFRLLSPIGDFARLSLKLSLPLRRDAWRPPRRSPALPRHCIARTHSESCVSSSASRRAPEAGSDETAKDGSAEVVQDAIRPIQLPHGPIGIDREALERPTRTDTRELTTLSSSWIPGESFAGVRVFHAANASSGTSAALHSSSFPDGPKPGQGSPPQRSRP